MRIRAEYKFAKRTDLEWSGVYGFRPDDQFQLKSLGEMYAVFRFSTPIEDFAVEKFGKILIEELQVAYFNNDEGFKSNLENLESAAFKMKKKMDVISSREEELMKQGVDMEMAIIVIKNEFLYGCVIGESEILIKRDEDLVNISEALIDKHQTNFIRTGSLALELQDKIALTTSKTYTDIYSIKNLLTNLDLNEIDRLELDTGGSIFVIADEAAGWFEKLIEIEVIEEDNTLEEVKEHEGLLLNQQDENHETSFNEVEIEKLEDELEAETKKIEDFDPKFDDDFEGGQEVKSAIELETNKVDTKLAEEQYEENEIEIESSNELGGNNQKDLEKRKNTNESSESVNNRVGSIKDKFKSNLASLSTFLTSLKERLPISKKQIEKPDSPDSENEEHNELNKNSSRSFAAIKLLVIKQSQKIRNYFKGNQSTYVHYLKLAGNQLKKLRDIIKFQFEKQILGKHLDRRMASKQKVKRNRWILLVTIILISFFAYTGIQNAQNNARERELREENEQAINNFQSRVDALELEVTEKRNSASSSEKSLLSSSITSLESEIRISKDASPEDYADQYNILINTIVSLQDDLLLVEAIEDVAVIANLAEEFQGANLTDLTYSEGALFATDAGTGNVYKLTPAINADAAVWASGLQNPYLITPNVNNELIIYDENESSAVSRLNPNEQNSNSRLAGLEPRNIGRIGEVEIFSGNNSLYELKPNYSQIYRRDQLADSYVTGGAAREEGFQSWKVSDELSSAVDIAVPNSIYVLTSSQGLQRYFGGGNNDLTFESFTNLTQSQYAELSSATALDVTDGPQDNTIVLGISSTQKIIVLKVEADGRIRLEKQMIFRGEGSTLSDIKEVVINGNELFVLDGNRVLRFNL